MVELNRIYNESCLDTMARMEKESVHLVFTSPPYPGVNNMWGELFRAENFNDAHTFLNSVWSECLRVLKPGCKLIINIANTKRRPYLPNVKKIYEWSENRCEPLGEIIWNKGYGQNGTAWGSFRSPSDPSLADQHEYILVFRKQGAREKPKEFNKIDLFNFKSWRNSIWSIPPAKASKVGHCAPFPPEIPKRLITFYSFEGEIVYDPFIGSGTTGLEAERLGRSWIGSETIPKYCTLAEKKIEAFRMQTKMELK